MWASRLLLYSRGLRAGCGFLTVVEGRCTGCYFLGREKTTFSPSLSPLWEGEVKRAVGWGGRGANCGFWRR